MVKIDKTRAIKIKPQNYFIFYSFKNGSLKAIELEHAELQSTTY